MPAMLDDPSAPTIYRTSGSAPFPSPHENNSSLPIDVYPRQVTLRDRVTVATIIPFSSSHNVPPSLLAYLCDQLNKEIEMGDTYPMIEGMTVDKFGSYWFQNFGAVMLLGNVDSADEVVEGKDWARECLGSFYIKPNYPGRSSHVCNAGFLVTDAARNKGVGRLMGESYLDWAPRLGYTYSVFNLVYETNVASCRIWDALGFKRIGRVKGAGNLRSHPGELIDAIIYGRELGAQGADYVSEERFDKIAFYLRYGKYPSGADRAEKSRLRSAATHYKLLEDGKLMLKDKEVISDPQKQYEVARQAHLLSHGGINKTTATLSERYHWVRIKETVSAVIRNCAECKELGKAPTVRADNTSPPRNRPPILPASHSGQGGVSAAGRILSLPPLGHQSPTSDPYHNHQEDAHFKQSPTSNPFDHHQEDHIQPHQTSVSPQVLNRQLPSSSQQSSQHHQQPSPQIPQLPHSHHGLPNHYMGHDQPLIDPQIMDDVHHLSTYNQSSHSHTYVKSGHSPTFDTHQHGEDSFQAMLGRENGGNADLDDMLIDGEEDGEGEEEDEGVGVGVSGQRPIQEAARAALAAGGGYGK
jgi:GNAT superfamily N-acetyltransferase